MTRRKADKSGFTLIEIIVVIIIIAVLAALIGPRFFGEVGKAKSAVAQQKMSQADSEYQDRPKNGLTCAACSLFRKPRSCEIVEGDISPNGWCKFFDLPD